MPPNSLRPVGVQLKTSAAVKKATATSVTLTSARPTTSTAVAAAATKKAKSPVITTPVAKKKPVGAAGSIRPGEIVATPTLPTLTEFTRRIVRPRDLLVLDFTFVNLRVTNDANGNFLLVRRDANKAAYLVVGFPPQHLLARAFFEDQANSEDPKNTDIPVPSRLADSSRLVFRVPNAVASLPYQLKKILDACRQFELSVVASATPPDPKYTIRPGWDISIIAETAM